jgi:hypothetical protein
MPRGQLRRAIVQETYVAAGCCEERETTVMPFLVFLSVCSYWRTVNVEMTKSTLQFLDTVERSKARSGALGFWAI